MKVRQIIKTITDMTMIALLPVLMLFVLTEQETHEWLGTAMTALFILHNILNHSWIRGLFRGNYTPARIFLNMINILLFLDMILQAGSGIMMSGISGYVFEFLHLDGDMELLKQLHRFGAYWGFILMSIHLGQHWNYMIGMGKKLFPAKKQTKKPIRISRGLTAIISVYGLAAFVRQNMIGYLFLKTAAIYFDDGKAQISYLWDCIAIIVLFAALGYYVQKALQKYWSRRRTLEQ